MRDERNGKWQSNQCKAIRYLTLSLYNSLSHTHKQYPYVVCVRQRLFQTHLVWEIRTLKVNSWQTITKHKRFDARAPALLFIMCVWVCACWCHLNNKVHVYFYVVVRMMCIFSLRFSFSLVAFNCCNILSSSLTLFLSFHSISFRCRCHFIYIIHGIYSWSIFLFTSAISRFFLFFFLFLMN